MKKLYFKPSLAFLMLGLFVIALLIPDLSFAYYRGRHHGSYGHYGHGRHGYSRHYGHGYHGNSKHYGYSHSRRSRHYGYRSYGGHHYYPNKYYRGNRYSYSPSRNYQKYPGSYLVTIPANTKVYSDSNVYQQSNAEYSGINSSAWQTLGLGQYSAALNIFAEEAQRHPNSGVPKAGYSLATAANGDLARGVWAMRRAFRIDPDSLHYLQLDEKNYLLVDNLIGQYSSQKIDDSDGKGFMISALHYLKHDYSAAKQSIIKAQQYGDKSSSITNLQRLIDQQLTTGQEN